MFGSRIVRIRKWHRRLVVLPRRVNIEGKGERWAFFDRLLGGGRQAAGCGCGAN